MIAKIGHGARIYGALLYNNAKVVQHTGAILSMHNMLETPDGNYTTGQLLSSFLPYLVANKKTEKPVLHVSLNPDMKDMLTDEEYVQIADDYMKRLGYGDQPYVVFKHHDIDRKHLHIVSTTVDKNGDKIPDAFEKKRSMEICRQLEKDYNLSPITEKQREIDDTFFQPVDCKKESIKSQIAAIVRYLPKYYGFQTLGSYNALLSLFNITAEHIKKERNGEIREGLVYFALDERGNKASNPFKSSLFGKQAGLAALQAHFESSKTISATTKTTTAQIVREGMNSTSNEIDLKNYLMQKGINVVIRRNDHERLFGITFIDHNTRQVFNGSHLGKQFSANVFHDLFSQGNRNFKENTEGTLQLTRESSTIIQPKHKKQVHPIFDFMIDTSRFLQDMGILDSLLLDPLSEDPEEQIFEFNMKRKKRKKRR